MKRMLLFLLSLLILVLLSINSTFTSMIHSTPVDRLPVAVAASQLTATKLTADDLNAEASLGLSVALSDTLAFAGAPGAAGVVDNAGAVYLFQHDGAAWQAAGKLTASDGEALDFFGRSLALHGDLLVVGANGDDDAGSDAGAAYIFQRTAQGWEEIAKLTPSMPNVISSGWSVATDGTTVVVGARNRRSQGEIINAGAVHVYEVVSGAWAEVARFSSGASGGAALSDLFGSAVGVYGNTIVVGAPNGNCTIGNCLYLYTRNGSQWAAAGTLASSDSLPADRLGSALAMNADWLLVGAPGKGAAERPNVGTAYLFAHDGTTWQEVNKLTPGRALPGSRFGTSVALDTDWAVVGAPESAGPTDRNESGATYLFRFTGTTWQAEAELSANDAAALDHFGLAVAVSGAYALVGAPDAEIGEADDTGAAYLFELSPENGGPTPTATATDVPDPGDTATPTATDMPDPGDTATPTATDMPDPGDTATPEATNTPEPDDTPGPGATVPPIPPTRKPGQPFSRDCEAMSVSEQSREDVLPGVAITWDSSFHCIEAPAEGPYALTVTVAYTGSAGGAIVLDDLQLTHTSPRPRGQVPTATLEIDGLPLVVAAGGSEALTLTGTYELVTAGATQLANLHFCASGQLEGGDVPFELGLNAHLRNAPGTQASEEAGPPVLSAIQVEPGPDRATIRWQTDQPATSRVIAGVGLQMSNPITISNGCDRAQEHSVTVENLQPNTDYSFQVIARNDDGFVAASDQLAFATQSLNTDATYLPLVQR